MAIRIDLGTLRPPKRMPDGTMVAEGLLTRAGVFSYRNPDGSERRELRPPEEVFRQDSLASFAMRPVTNDHPPELINAKNAKRYAVGTVGETVIRDDDHVRAKISVYDAETIAEMEAGKSALSCGYEVDIEDKAGIHPVYGRYDCVQRNIRGNHLAIVQAGRAGEASRVRMDAAVMISTGGSAMPNPQDLETALVQLGEQTKRADDAEAQAKAEKARADTAEGKLQGLEGRADAVAADAKEVAKLRAENEELKGKLAASEKQRQDAEDPEKRRAAIQRRVRIEGTAAAVLGEGRFDEFSDRQLMMAVIQKMPKVYGGGDVKAEASDELVQARFDLCAEAHANGERGKQKLREVTATRQDATPEDMRSPREKFVAAQMARGLAPLPNRKAV